MEEGPEGTLGMNSRAYPILWVKDCIKSKSVNYSVAVCSRTKEIFRFAASIPGKNLADDLEVIMMTDLYADEGGCEEGNRCLHVKCPLNKTTNETWKWHDKNWSKTEFESLVRARNRYQSKMKDEIDRLLNKHSGSDTHLVISLDGPLFEVEH